MGGLRAFGPALPGRDIGARLKQDWALLIGFGVAITGCCGALAYIAAGGTEVTMTIAAAIAFGVAGQVMLLIMHVRQADLFGEKIATVTRNAGEIRAELRSKMELAFSRIQQVQAETKTRTDSVIGGISDLKTSYSALRNSLSEQVANPPPPKQPEPVLRPAWRKRPAMPRAARSLLRCHEKSNFSLEPVVDMRDRRTAHYRLSMSMPLGRVEVGGRTLLEQVSRSGLRPQLDRLAIDEALGLSRRLRQRDPELCILTPIGPETLADHIAVSRIMSACLQAGDAAKGLVLELNHASLPMLTPQGLEGLAQLSRQGRSFALSDASPGALDLSAMKTLHVKMVGLDASELAHIGGVGAAAQFAQQARLHGITSMVTNVNDPQLIQHIAQVTPLACGACFAAPRRVKRVGLSEAQNIGQAA